MPRGIQEIGAEDCPRCGAEPLRPLPKAGTPEGYSFSERVTLIAAEENMPARTLGLH